MSDDLDYLKTHVPGYADYADANARHHVDAQVRAILGEALTDARERLKPKPPLGEQLDGLILRCEFGDQRFIRAADHARFDQGLVDRVHALDRGITEVAERLRALSATDALGAALDEAARLLDERFGAVADAPSTTT